MSPGDELLNGQCMRRSRFFLSERGGGGGEWGSKPNGEKTALIFLCFVLGFFSPKFSGDAGRGPTIYEGGSPNANFYRI